MTQTNIEEQTRAQVAEILPRAIEAVMESYQFFIDKQKSSPEAKAKDFKEHHNACKVALGHVALLIKLAQWADVPDPERRGEEQRRSFMQSLENAEKELNDYDEDNV